MLRYAVRLPVQPETSCAYSKWPYSKCMGPYSKTKVLGLALKTLFPEERLSSAKQILRFYILSAGPSLYIILNIIICLTFRIHYIYIYTYQQYEMVTRFTMFTKFHHGFTGIINFHQVQGYHQILDQVFTRFTDFIKFSPGFHQVFKFKQAFKQSPSFHQVFTRFMYFTKFSLRL